MATMAPTTQTVLLRVIPRDSYPAAYYVAQDRDTRTTMILSQRPATEAEWLAATNRRTV